jgi:murein DD-endopeptidase MepM/ murein hydrolase activator NlpD
VTLNVPPTFEVMLAMAAEVTSEVAIDRVEFYWDHDGESTLLGTVEEAPYCFSWKPTVQLEAGDYEPSAFGDRVVMAVAYDLRGRGGSHTQWTTQSPALHLPVAAAAEGIPKVIYMYFDLDPDVGVIADWRGGQVTYDGHTGTDYDWPPESEVRAARGGTVKEVRNDADDEPDPAGGYGNYIKLLHPGLDDGVQYHTLYCHLMKGSIPWQKDDIVLEGDMVGREGTSGNSDGYHLHLEVRVSDGEVPICPYHAGMIEGPLSFPQQ